MKRGLRIVRVFRIVACASIAWLAPQQEEASACGGPDVVDVGEVLVPERGLVAELLEDPYEGFDLDEFRFLRPFELAKRDPLGLLALAMTDPDAGTDPPPSAAARVDVSAWEAALRAGDLAKAKQAAQTIVEHVLDLPAPLATASATELQRAVEYLDLAPKLAGVDKAVVVRFFVDRAASETLPKWLDDARVVRETPRAQMQALLAKNPQHPRAASLGLVALNERVHTELPSGWPGEIAAPPAVWNALEHGFDAWLSANANHPLRDLALLSKLRVVFLRGDAKRAWDVLLGLYPRHPLRVVWEMRHLLLADMRPTHIDVTQLKDPVLASALVRESNALSVEQWTALWKRSEKEPDAAWAINLQERLFVQAIRLAQLGKAPSALPGPPRARTPAWAELHTAALLAAHRDEEASQQAALLKVGKDRVAAKLQARVALRRCDFVRASEAAAKLGPDSVRYTLEVLADEPALRSLAARTDALGARAMHALALRTLGDAQWQAAAEVWRASHTAEAERWREAAKLAADTSYAGRTKLGAWLLSRGGAALFPDSERAYSRGLKARLDALDDASQPKPQVCASLRERDRLADALLHGGRRERALMLYADALHASDVDPKSARRTLSAADALYNQLLNWDASGSVSYPKLLAASPASAALREAGKRLRAGAR
jgi:hypothetical protein